MNRAKAPVRLFGQTHRSFSSAYVMLRDDPLPDRRASIGRMDAGHRFHRRRRRFAGFCSGRSPSEALSSLALRQWSFARLYGRNHRDVRRAGA